MQYTFIYTNLYLPILKVVSESKNFRFEKYFGISASFLQTFNLLLNKINFDFFEYNYCETDYYFYMNSFYLQY